MNVDFNVTVLHYEKPPTKRKWILVQELSRDRSCAYLSKFINWNYSFWYYKLINTTFLTHWSHMRTWMHTDNESQLPICELLRAPCYIIWLTECNSDKIQQQPICSWYYIRVHRHTSQSKHMSPDAIIAVCIYYMFQLHCSINSKWQFLSLRHSVSDYSQMIVVVGEDITIHQQDTHVNPYDGCSSCMKQIPS